MSHDEHGPAYPDGGVVGYRCPICNGDKHRYKECDYPGCPDGRDQSDWRTFAYPTHEQSGVLCVSCLLMVALVFAVVIVGGMFWIMNWAAG